MVGTGESTQVPDRRPAEVGLESLLSLREGRWDRIRGGGIRCGSSSWVVGGVGWYLFAFRVVGHFLIGRNFRILASAMLDDSDGGKDSLLRMAMEETLF